MVVPTVQCNGVDQGFRHYLSGVRFPAVTIRSSPRQDSDPMLSLRNGHRQMWLGSRHEWTKYRTIAKFPTSLNSFIIAMGVLYNSTNTPIICTLFTNAIRLCYTYPICIFTFMSRRFELHICVLHPIYFLRDTNMCYFRGNGVPFNLL